MPALNHSQKRPTKRGNAVERQEQKLKTFAENSTWTSSGENRLGQFDFERDDTKNNEKLEKNSDLEYSEGVKLQEKFASLLSEIDDLTPELVSSLAVEFAQRVKSSVDETKRPSPGPLPENPVRYADRKAHPEYASMNAVEFLRAVWGKWIDAGCVYQDDIGKRDNKLVQGVRNACSYLKLDAAEILPPPKRTRLDNEVSNSSRVKDLIESRRAAARRYAEKQRSIKLIPTY
jgi:hypothetical protein